MWCRKRSRGEGRKACKLDPHLVIPTSLDIMLEGMLDAICFVIGCMLLVLAASTFLHKFGAGNNPADVLLLCYPFIFGAAALIRIFLCNSRRLLYHSLFLQGVLLDFNHTKSGRDLLLLYTYLGFAAAVGVLFFDSVQSVQDGMMGWKGMAVNTVVFMSPLYYMVSSLLNSLRLEKEAVNCMCVQKMDSEVTISSAFEHLQLIPIYEGGFCKAARKGNGMDVSIEMAKSSSDPDDLDHFRLRDVFWVPRLVSGKSKSEILLVVAMPILALLAMLLGLVSLAWLIKHRTDVPEIESLTVDVAGLSPDFSFEITDYSLLLPRLQPQITLSMYANTDRTNFLNASVVHSETPVDPQESLSGSKPGKNSGVRGKCVCLL